MMLRTRDTQLDSWTTYDDVQNLKYSQKSFDLVNQPDWWEVSNGTTIPGAEREYVLAPTGEVQAKWVHWEDSQGVTHLLLASSDVFVMNAQGTTVDRIKI